VPEFGYNKMLSPDLSLGISVVGHGGMNPYFNVGGTETITLSEDSLGIAWGKKF